jgi:hypothetical protein
MHGNMVTLNLRITEYGNRVLGVIKEKFGLRDKSEALARFIDLYGEEFVEKEVREDVILDVIRSVRAMEKKAIKPVTFDELDRLCGLKK